eukprot:4702372-Prorocentrum_lima.AAC.1
MSPRRPLGRSPPPSSPRSRPSCTWRSRYHTTMMGDTCALAACRRMRLRGCFCEPSQLNADGCTT